MCQYYRKQYEPSIQCDTSPLLTRSQQSIRESHVTVKKEACPRCTQSDNYCPLSCCNTKYECKVWLTGVLCQCSQIYRIWPIQSVNLYLPLSILLSELIFWGGHWPLNFFQFFFNHFEKKSQILEHNPDLEKYFMMTEHSMASEYSAEKKFFCFFLAQIQKPLYNALKYLVRKHINK